LGAQGLPAGAGRLRFASIDGATALVGCRAESPLKILVPRRRGRSAWAFLTTYGGGLVAGDHMELDVEVGAGATALLATQAETKVYRSSGGAAATQVLRARVARGGTLAVMPDPVSPFSGARYRQEQRCVLEDGASLLLVDALVAGRTACGERWAFESYRSRTEIASGGNLILGEALSLQPRGGASLADRMGRYNAFAFAVVVGPAFSTGASGLLDRWSRAPIEVGAPLLSTVCPLAGGALLRAAAVSAEHLARFLRDALSFVAEPLGDDPFQRRW
jgi:urease accessory protein